MDEYPTYHQIAVNYETWMDYFDPSGQVDKETFDTLSIEKKIDMIIECFGLEEENKE